MCCSGVWLYRVKVSRITWTELCIEKGNGYKLCVLGDQNGWVGDE